MLSVFLSSVNAQTLKTGFANIEGRKVYYEVKGEGPVVVLIHGFSLDTRMWDDQFDVLAKNYRVVRYDVSGYGRSSIPDRKISAVAELNELLRILGIQKATIVGMSMGGAIAINFTLEYPLKTEGLITVGSALSGYAFREDRDKLFENMITMARDSGVANAKELWLSDRFLTPVNGSHSIAARVRRIVTDWSGIQFSNPAVWGFIPLDPPAIRRLGEIRVPTLVVVGASDEPDILDVADTLSAQIKDVMKIVVPKAGHLINLEQPDALNRLMLEFLSRINIR